MSLSHYAEKNMVVFLVCCFMQDILNQLIESCVECWVQPVLLLRMMSRLLDGIGTVAHSHNIVIQNEFY